MKLDFISSLVTFETLVHGCYDKGFLPFSSELATMNESYMLLDELSGNSQPLKALLSCSCLDYQVLVGEGIIAPLNISSI